MSTESVDPRFANYQRDAALQQRVDSMQKNIQLASREQYRVAIVVGQWHGYIVDRLLVGALDALLEKGVTEANTDIISAPGAYEMPLVVKTLITKKHYAAVVTLGAVIKGETPHFDYVAGECARGLAEVSRLADVPVGFGVLTVNSVDQALARAQAGEANKGREAVLAALDVADLMVGIQL